MKVKVIPVLEDNYMYLIIEEHTREAVAVDVAVPKRVRTDKGCYQGIPYHSGWSRRDRTPIVLCHLIYYLWVPLKLQLPLMFVVLQFL